MAEKKDPIRSLIDTGRRAGKLTSSEISDAMEEYGNVLDVEAMEKLYEELEAELGVTVKIAGSDRARATMTCDGRVLCSCGAELECDHETGDMPEVCPICGKIIDWSWFTFKEAGE